MLYALNQGFEQVVGQQSLLEKLGLGHHPWNALRVIAEENRAEVNFELVERLAECEQSDWSDFGRLRHAGRRSFEIRKMCSSKPTACGSS
jgi:hypothetical protein